MLDWQIDDLLERWAVEGKRRFSPSSVCRDLGTSDFQAVTTYMLNQINRKLVVRYEVECPYGHSVFSVTDPTKIQMERRRCPHCEIDYEFVPDPERVWLVFDFTPEFVDYAKKKVPHTSSGDDQGTVRLAAANAAPQPTLSLAVPPGLSLKTASTFKVHLRQVDLLGLYNADPSEIRRRLDEVHRLSAVYADESRRRVKQRTVTSKQVGDEMEHLIHYILNHTSGFFEPQGSTPTKISELDNVVHVQQCPDHWLSRWHPYILVESKNYGKKVNKKLVNDFLQEVVRAAYCRVGIMVARTGVTGSAETLLAMAVGQMAEEHRHFVMVLTDEHLEELANGENLFNVLHRLWNLRCYSCA